MHPRRRDDHDTPTTARPILLELRVTDAPHYRPTSSTTCAPNPGTGMHVEADGYLTNSPPAPLPSAATTSCSAHGASPTCGQDALTHMVGKEPAGIRRMHRR